MSELTCSIFLKESVFEENEGIRIAKISRAFKMISSCLCFTSKEDTVLKQPQLPFYILLSLPLHGNNSDTLIRGLIQRYRDKEEFLLNLWQATVKISELKELMPMDDEKKFNEKLKHDENKVIKTKRESGVRLGPEAKKASIVSQIYKYGQEIYCDIIMKSKIEIKLATLDLLEYILEEIFLPLHPTIKNKLNIPMIFKTFSENSDNEDVIIRTCVIMEKMKKMWPSIWLNQSVDHEIEQILLDKARKFIPKRGTIVNGVVVPGSLEENELQPSARTKNESVMDISLSIDNRSEAYSVGDPNEISPEAEEEFYMREIKTKEIEKKKKEKEEAFDEEEQVNPIIIKIEEWLLEGDIPLIGKSEYIGELFKKLENFDIFISLILDPFHFYITKLWEIKYPELKGKNTSVLDHYINGPKFRKPLENPPKNFNYYNLRSYKATMALCDYRNFQYIATANPKATEMFFKRHYVSMRKEDVIINMNNVAKLTLCYLQRDTLHSLKWILYYNILFQYLMYLDFNAVANLIGTVINNIAKKDTLSEGEQNLVWKYFQITGFFPELANIMVNHLPTQEFFMKIDANYKPMEVRGIIETIADYNTKATDKNLVARDFYPLFEELFGWVNDIDRVKDLFIKRKKERRVATLWNKLRAMKSFYKQLSVDKDKVGQELVEKIISNSKKASNPNEKEEKTGKDSVENQNSQQKISEKPMPREPISKKASNIAETPNFAEKQSDKSHFYEGNSVASLKNMSEGSKKSVDMFGEQQVEENNKQQRQSQDPGGQKLLKLKLAGSGSRSMNEDGSPSSVEKHLSRGVNLSGGKSSGYNSSTNTSIQTPHKLPRKFSKKEKVSPLKSNNHDNITKKFFEDDIRNDFSSPARKLNRRFSTNPQSNTSQQQEFVSWKKEASKKEPPQKYFYFLLGNYLGDTRDLNAIEKLVPCPINFFNECKDDDPSKLVQFGSDFISQTDEFSMVCLDLLGGNLKEALDNYAYLPIKNMIGMRQSNFANLFQAIFQPQDCIVFDNILQNYLFKIKFHIYNVNNGGFQAGELVNYILNAINLEQLASFKENLLQITRNHFEFLQKTIVGSHAWIFQRDTKLLLPGGINLEQPLGSARLLLLETFMLILKVNVADCKTLMRSVNDTTWHVFINWFLENRFNNISQCKILRLFEMTLKECDEKLWQVLLFRINLVNSLKNSINSIYQNRVYLKKLNVDSFFFSIKKFIKIIAELLEEKKSFKSITSQLSLIENWGFLKGLVFPPKPIGSVPLTSRRILPANLRGASPKRGNLASTADLRGERDKDNTPVNIFKLIRAVSKATEKGNPPSQDSFEIKESRKMDKSVLPPIRAQSPQTSKARMGPEHQSLESVIIRKSKSLEKKRELTSSPSTRNVVIRIKKGEEPLREKDKIITSTYSMKIKNGKK